MNTFDSLFNVSIARSHAYESYDAGTIAFLSNGFEDNGVVGFVEPQPRDKVYPGPAISVSAFCEATVQEQAFIARGNGGSGLVILEPKEPMSHEHLLWYAAYINSVVKWRFSYGRMVTKDRISKLECPATPTTDIGQVAVVLPRPSLILADIAPAVARWKSYPVTELFTIVKGNAEHSMANLEAGEVVTISRVASASGLAGFYAAPPDATIYPAGLITVSTLGGEAFVQPREFIATDNVLVLYPQEELPLTTVFFIAVMLNRHRWRYSYGRQCYKTKFEQVNISLPITANGSPDQPTMAAVLEQSLYWPKVKGLFEGIDTVKPLQQEELSTEFLAFQDMARKLFSLPSATVAEVKRRVKAGAD